MSELINYLKQSVQDGASDLFLIAGSPVCDKIDGRILPISKDALSAVESESLIRDVYHLAKRDMTHYLETGDDDFSFSQPSLARFRASAYRQRGSMAIVIRVVTFEIPDWKKLSIPESVMQLSELSHGLVLVSGTAGSGKSTTQACIIDQINRTRALHIITLEDPIEYLHRNRKSIVSQREIAIDTEDYLSALRACLRQAPDVILLGEMRDYETIRTAMTAAETGHLVIATLHTRGAVNTIDRIIDSFPSTQQSQIRVQLATTLRTVISQQLLPDKNGGRIPAFEVMHSNSAIRNMIRDCKHYQINTVIQTSAEEGMQSMDQAILQLLKSGKISAETALNYADNLEQMRRWCVSQ